MWTYDCYSKKGLFSKTKFLYRSNQVFKTPGEAWDQMEKETEFDAKNGMKGYSYRLVELKGN